MSPHPSPSVTPGQKVGAFRRHGLHVAGVVLSLVVFCGAIYLLHRELRQYHLHDIEQSLASLPTWRIAAALGITVLSYFLLTFYDLLALRLIGNKLPYRQVAMASFASYVASYNFGATLGGTTMRYRVYSALGLSTIDIVKVIAICSLTFLLGLAVIGGTTLTFESLDLPEDLANHIGFTTARPLGVLLLVSLGAYAIASLAWRKPVEIRGWTFSIPAFRWTVAQAVLGAVEICVAASVVYVLIPPGPNISWPLLVAVFLLAMTTGDVSHVPAGLGVFEAVMLVMLEPSDPAALISALLAFRVIYYLLPLAIAATALAINEVLRRRGIVTQAATIFGRWVPEVVPRLLAVTTFLGGAMLVVSGSLPADGHALAWLQRFVPLPALELTHFFGSVLGVVLLVLARGLQLRLDAAYHLTLAILGCGAVFALVRGWDVHEAVALAVLFAILLPCRSYFNRRASLWSETFSAPWAIAVAVVIVTSIWLGIFSHKRVEYSEDLWWQVAFSADASRSLRAAVGACAALLFVALARLLRPSVPRPGVPTQAELDTAATIVRSATSASANLALIGDKALLFNSRRTALVMYAVSGRAWVAMGDPVGPASEQADMAWQFQQLCERDAAWPVFYQVSPDTLPIYVDLGLTLLKLGEEARVPLAEFDLETPRYRSLRHSWHAGQKAGMRMEIVPPSDVPALLPAIRAISDAWLETKHAAEKGFSLGYFDEQYLARCPLALVRKDDKPVAFANLWQTDAKEELSLDLMRHGPDAPPGVMDYLFVELIRWAAEQKYRWFNMGMAPLAGLDNHEVASLWQRLGTLVYSHGEHFYNFQGLRHYKDKFHPVWQPRYLASPGGVRLPRILAAVTSLVSGGFLGAIGKHK